MPTIFFTGFPGFLGSELLPRVLHRAPEAEAVCLVQPKFADLARDRAEALSSEDPSLEGRIRLVEGDVTEPGLALDGAAELRRETVEVFHLAAISVSDLRRASRRVRPLPPRDPGEGHGVRGRVNRRAGPPGRRASGRISPGRLLLEFRRQCPLAPRLAGPRRWIQRTRRVATTVRPAVRPHQMPATPARARNAST